MRKKVNEEKTKNGVKKVRITGKRLFIALIGAAVLFAGCGGDHGDRSDRDKDKKESATYETRDGGGDCYTNDLSLSGETSKSYSYDYYSDDIYVAEAAACEEYYYDDYEYYDDASYDNSGSYQTSNAEIQGENAENTNRKLIRNISLDLETLEYDALIGTIRAKTTALGGYIESSYEYNGSTYYSGECRNASMTLRIPADRADEMISEMADISNITSRNESVSDVTLTYVDMESHKEMLEIERDTFLDMLEQCETIEDMIYIENCLTDVRYQIESMESQLRTYDNLVDYTTISVYIKEVEELTPVEPEQEPTFWEKVSDQFHESIEDFGEDAQDFLFNVIDDLPYIILWAVILIIALIVVKVIIKKITKKYGEKFNNKFGKYFGKKNDVAAAAPVEEVKAETSETTETDTNKENE